MTRQVFTDVTEWQKATFGKINPYSVLTHLKEEVVELQESIVHYPFEDKDEVLKEFADCFILLMGAAAGYGLSYVDIAVIINEKMSINKARKWQAPDENGVIRHIDEHSKNQS